MSFLTALLAASALRAPAFSPSDIDPSVLVGWYQSRTATEIKQTAGGAAAVSGQPAGAWTGKEAVPDTLVSTGANRLEYYEPSNGKGRPVLRGDGVSKHLLGTLSRTFTHVFVAAKVRYPAGELAPNDPSTTFFFNNFFPIMNLHSNTGNTLILDGFNGNSKRWVNAVFTPDVSAYTMNGNTYAAGNMIVDKDNMYTVFMIALSQGYGGAPLVLLKERIQALYSSYVIGEILLLNNPDATTITKCQDYMSSYWRGGANNPLLVLSGDSITWGAKNNLIDRYGDLYHRNRRNSTVDVLNIAISGQTAQALIAGDPSKISPYLVGGRSFVYTGTWGTNDVGSPPYLVAGGDPDVLYANVLLNRDNIRAMGGKFGVMTIIDRSDAGFAPGFQAARTTYNNRVMANQSDFDFVIPLHQVVGLGITGDSTGAYFDIDHVHPNQAGQQLIDANVYATLDAQINASALTRVNQNENHPPVSRFDSYRWLRLRNPCDARFADGLHRC